MNRLLTASAALFLVGASAGFAQTTTPAPTDPAITDKGSRALDLSSDPAGALPGSARLTDSAIAARSALGESSSAAIAMPLADQTAAPASYPICRTRTQDRCRVASRRHGRN